MHPIQKKRHARYLLPAGALALGIVICLMLAFRPANSIEGTPENVFSRLEIGMTQHDAMNVLESFNRRQSIEYSVTTNDGQSVKGRRVVMNLDVLPRPSKIKSARIAIMDYDDRGIIVTFGYGGILKSKFFRSSNWQDLLLHIRGRGF